MSGGYGQFCPIAQAAEVLTGRWRLLVVRELLLGNTWSGLKERCRVGARRQTVLLI